MPGVVQDAITCGVFFGALVLFLVILRVFLAEHRWSRAPRVDEGWATATAAAE